uniref:UDP-glucuronosyltransferase 40AD1 n=1 Tax=Lissorhoptrus oryzophilus TaxID=308863 RepID=A0A2R4FXH8_9CUCU|nr:UDP-glucuronosyltransferase 40AD1 [Lissorhoptrus oryzophilus]
MGSHLTGKNFEFERIKMFLNLFKNLKQRVIWKFDRHLPNKSDNVLIRKWLPQNDILAHPQIKLFITHAGYGSILETIYHGVPCLMIPVFMDQFNNAYRSVQLGFALKLSYNDPNFSEALLMKLVQELLNNQRYFENAKKRQELFHDRPMRPMETAIYWIEYVIRHKGADHLKLGGAKLPWYRFYFLDVILFLAVFVFVFLYILYCITFFTKTASKQKQN